LTRRRTRYRSIASLQRDNRICRACVDAGFPLESLPVVQPYSGQRAYMFGQAPGVVEGEERLPWRGRAGRTLRRWLELGEEEFYATFYCASVTRCYPGKDPKRGDRKPTRHEQELCAFWLEWELRLIRPALIVPVGTLAIKQLLGIDDLGSCIGASFPHHGAVAVPLPHPSGASAWTNERENRKRTQAAIQLIRHELAQIGRNPVDR
jgi:uracil-DNA glycosylase